MSLVTQHCRTTPVRTLHQSLSTFAHHCRDLFFPGWVCQHAYIRLRGGSTIGGVASKQSSFFRAPLPPYIWRHWRSLLHRIHTPQEASCSSLLKGTLQDQRGWLVVDVSLTRYHGIQSACLMAWATCARVVYEYTRSYPYNIIEVCETLASITSQSLTF